MTRDELQERITNHNRFLVAVGIMLVPTSIALWYASFWIVKFAAMFLFELFGWSEYAEHAASAEVDAKMDTRR